jgi:hypothetical protein
LISEIIGLNLCFVNILNGGEMKNSVIYTIMLVLLATVLVFGQGSLYTETFSSGMLDNTWYPGFRASLGPDAKVMEPYSIAGNPSGDGWAGRISTFYSVTDTIGVASSWSGDVNWTDYFVEAWLYIPVDNPPVSGSEYFTLEFRVDSTGNSSGYQFAATFNPNAMFAPPGLRFRKRVEGSASTLHHWDSGNIPGGLPATTGWHKLGVNIIGDQFWFFFNDQEMPGNPYTDTTSTAKFDQGGVGFYGFRFDFFSPSSVDTINVIVDDVEVSDPITSLPSDDGNTIIEGFNLEQNYPNPFNPSTQISFQIPTTEFVQIIAYNSLGQKMRTILSEQLSTGIHQVSWDGKDDNGVELPAGVYYYQMKAGDFQQTRKMLFVK